VIITDSDRDLWLAVINQALDDLTATKRPLKRSARAWFLSSNRMPAVSFGSAIGLEPTAVRRRQLDLIHGVRKT
jgi:truncated hemoglobin YjbI